MEEGTSETHPTPSNKMRVKATGNNTTQALTYQLNDAAAAAAVAIPPMPNKTKVALRPTKAKVRAATASIFEHSTKEIDMGVTMTEETKLHGPKFSNNEDMALCRAVVDVLHDSTNANNQIQDEF